MKALLTTLLVLVPSVAFAQYDPNQPPPPPPPGYNQPAPGPGYAAPPTSNLALRNGLTFEANIGLGFIWARNEGEDSDTEGALAGLDLGVGGWINNRMALTARVAGATYSPEDGVRFTTGFFGPSLQYWVDDHLWLGGGAGLAFAAVHIDDFDEQPDPETGFGLDLRLGYTFTAGNENTFNVSLEYNPGFFTFDTGVGDQSVQINSFGILFGYQHL
ncbi:MAG: hypothetical protein ABI867_25030 [Kofleriaceae bacterium]